MTYEFPKPEKKDLPRGYRDRTSKGFRIVHP